MYNNLQIKLLNTKDELISFPIDQSLSLEFSESVEDSFLTSYIFLVQGMDSPALIHVGDTYNQNIGIVKESFNNVDIKTTVTSRDPFVVKVTPVKPLTPGYSYTLLVKGDLPNEYMSVTKVTSYSPSNIELLGSNTYNEEAVLIFNEDSDLTNNKHIIDITLKGHRQTFDIKREKTVNFQGYQIKFISDLYLEGESFNILVTDKTATTTTYTVSLTTSPSKNVKPIDPSANIKLTEEDLINFNNNNTATGEPIVEEATTQTITYTGYNSFVLTFNKDLTDKLDYNSLTYRIREAFGMYTLSSMGLYDSTKTYEIEHTILDAKSVEFFVKEITI